MFPNINIDEIKEDENHKKGIKIKEYLKQSFNIQNIIIYIISFLLSTIEFGGVISPFGLSILAATTSNMLPIGIITIVTSIGVLIGFRQGQFIKLSSYSINFHNNGNRIQAQI